MALGVIFSLLASVCFNLNNLMEKRAVDGMVAISGRRIGQMIRLLCTSRLWMSGFVVGIAAVGFTAIAYSLAPIAVVQSIFGIGLVILVLASRLYLHERMSRREWCGVVVIIVAVALVSVTLQSSNSPGLGGSTMRVLITSTVTIACSALVFAVLRRLSGEPGVPFGITSGLLYGVAALQIKGASVFLAHHAVLWAIRQTFVSPYPYVFVATSVLGLFTFQTGLQRCRVAVVVPITNIVASIYVVVAGMLAFDESLPDEAVFTVLRIAGFALVLLGGWLFATGPAAVAELERVVVHDAVLGSDGATNARRTPPGGKANDEPRG